MTPFEELGERLDAAWAVVSRRTDVFAEVAAEVLGDDAALGGITADDVVRWALSTEVMPPQPDLDARFGQPPLTVFSTERFVVTVLFWVDGATTVHQHAFSGAFRVLAGSSVHTRYTQEDRRVLTPRLVVGAVRAGAPELLHAGDVRTISSGPGFVHSLFHLDRPSVTLLVRTRHEADVERQYTYLPPSVGFDPFELDPRATRQRQILGMLFHTDAPAYRREALALLDRADVEQTFHVLRQARRLDHDGTFRTLAEHARARHGDVVDALVSSVEEERRRADLHELRGSVTDVELRFFVAVLLLAGGREGALALARARVPDRDPLDTLAAWIDALAKVRFPVQAGPATFELSAVDVPIDPVALAVARALLEGATADAIAARLGDAPELERTRTALLGSRVLRSLFG